MFDDKNIKYKEFKTILNLGTVGNVELKYKGQIYVLKALRKLNKINKKYHYYMIGGGNKTRLLNYVKKYKMERDVTFIDNIPHEQVLKELMNIDIYIQPSLQEGMPRALIEAMSVGCVCVGSNAGGIPELLSDKYIFKKRKYMHLVKIIKMLETASLKEISIENHHRATDFNRDKLDEKRRRFYMNFKNNMR